MIKTWKERVDANQFENFFSRQDAMQAEIDELRTALAERDAEILRLTTALDFDRPVLMELIAKYRAVNSESPAVEQDAWRAILAHVRRLKPSPQYRSN